MLVSLRWFSQYVSLPDDVDALADRLSLSGLNHEGSFEFDGDTVFDLEVTSNRGDCLGHIGVAREIAVLYDTPLELPPVLSGEGTLATGGEPIESSLSVENQFVDACPRYTARLIRGVTIGPSPDWMVRDLRAAYSKYHSDGRVDAYQPINNVVDATNFVLMETGSPLHAFDYDRLAGRQIVVRPGRDGETMTAIDHREYAIDDQTCVIADAEHPQAIAGVMGGRDSEVTEATKNIVIEAATFKPLSVRRTARRLKLHSPSSFRFERRVDAHGLPAVADRVCQLITEIAGGTVAPGRLDTLAEPPSPPVIRLQLRDIERILGITVGENEVIRILQALGCNAEKPEPSVLSITPPTFRSDLIRDADLIEEVARIHGYDKIPEDVPVAVTPSMRRPFDDATSRIRGVLTAAGYSEAMTPSVVTSKLDLVVSPWTGRPPLRTLTAMLKGSQTLRRSLIPSLIESRAKNWSAASIHADLFEIAHVYLPPADGALPTETYCVSVVGDDYFGLKGTIETLLGRLGVNGPVRVEVIDGEGFAAGTLVEVYAGETKIGYLGRIDASVVKSMKLPGDVVAAELSLDALLPLARLVPEQQSVSPFPAIRRDLNFVVDEAVRWSQMHSVAVESIGPSLSDLQYRETYRDEKKDGPGRKRLLLTVALQSDRETLSGDQADEMVRRLIDRATGDLGAELLG